MTQKLSWAEEATTEFVKKINHHVPIDYKIIKSKNFSRDDKVKKIKKEEELILKKIELKDYLVLFDETGYDFKNSIEFSQKLFAVFENSASTVHFLIGGAYGVSDTIKNRAHLKVKLSSLTMNHHVAQIMALEQIYRAIMIKNNKPYHNE
jgi:23S rRNA (pseudouridine1915-N3)-methyltransferase